MSRDTWLLIALGALAFSSALASVGAWLLLWRDRDATERHEHRALPRRRRRGRHRAPRRRARAG